MRLVKNLTKRVVKFLVDFCNTINSLRIIVINTDMRNHIEKLETAELLTILANGPSLKYDLDKIDYTKGDFLVVNDFYKSPYYKIIKPKFHVLADPLYFRTDEDLQPFIDAVDWNMRLFVPFNSLKAVRSLRNMPNVHIEVIPYNMGSYNGFKYLKNWLYRHGLAMPIAQNVLVPSIFNGINMGYKEIRIYGADHSWTENIRVDNQNRVCLTDSHFYDMEEVHMSPWYKCSGDQYLMHEILRDLAQMFDSYHCIKEYADSKHCRVLNYTKNSFIDAFERA